MIDYKRSEISRADGPRDVEVITDDGNAEMVALEEMIDECGFDIELPSDPDGDGNFRFTIPGLMVGEFAETVYDIDGGKLEELTDQWNQETLDAAEE